MDLLTSKAPDKSLAELLMEFGESMKPLYEFIAGQKADLEHRGWNGHTAERMSAELFAHLLWMMRVATPSGPKVTL